jgi:membrane-bound lytic murein transglycosylase B
MTKGRTVATAMIGAAALLLSLAPMSLISMAHAATCGSSPAGFEAWKREFGAEAQGKGVGQTAASAASR